MGPRPAVAAVRLAVRRTLAALEPGCSVVVACSGGADSLALLAGAVFEARHLRQAVVAVTVDHGLQSGSTDRARAVAAQAVALGAARSRVHTVQAGRPVAAGVWGGPEAAARAARYAALAEAAAEVDAPAVLLGHTRDDQAETVLLGLARGSGARSLAGMARVNGLYHRPLLDIPHRDTVAACEAEGIEFWRDPHNLDPAYARVRVRHEAMPVLERTLGPGVADALARTARLLRDDADALDDLAERGLAATQETPHALRVTALSGQPAAVRRRVLRLAALEAGCPAAELFLVHVDALDALVTNWHGQREVHLPGHVRARRVRGVLRFGRAGC
jgi:tRNA(Ile)-lysidine synthase